MKYWLKQFLFKTTIKAIDGVIFDNDVISLIKCNKAESGKYIVPLSVLYIERKAFMGCELSIITLPQELLCIKENAFKDCLKLFSINIPPKVLYLHRGIFSGCKTLGEIHAQNPVPPQCISYQWGGCFDDEVGIINQSKQKYSSNSSCFDGVDKSRCKLYVPKGSYESYSKADVWREFQNIIEEDM